MRLIKAALAGGVVLFLWSSISWQVLPWHNKTFKTFRDESIVTQILIATAGESGVYLLPGVNTNKGMEEKTGDEAKQPFAFVVFNRNGYGDMKIRMLLALLENMLTALVAAWLLSRSGITGFGPRVWFMAALGLFAGLAVHVPNAIWWGHPPAFTAVDVLDLIIGWILAGLAIAKLA